MRHVCDTVVWILIASATGPIWMCTSYICHIYLEAIVQYEWTNRVFKSGTNREYRYFRVEGLRWEQATERRRWKSRNACFYKTFLLQSDAYKNRPYRKNTTPPTIWPLPPTLLVLETALQNRKNFSITIIKAIPRFHTARCMFLTKKKILPSKRRSKGSHEWGLEFAAFELQGKGERRR